MPPHRDNRISDLYHEALARAPEERDAFLMEACGGDEALRNEVESLLAFEPPSARFLERPAAGVAADAAGETSMIDRLIRLYRSWHRPAPAAWARSIARTLATLNDPHVGAIYGLEESDGITALVLELVEGPTLADCLERGPLPLAGRSPSTTDRLT